MRLTTLMIGLRSWKNVRKTKLRNFILMLSIRHTKEVFKKLRI